jgi:hypothetical protein
VVHDVPRLDARGLRPPPWEERDRFGLVNALVLTIRQVLGSPARLFGSMPVGLGALQPVLFAALLALLTSIVDWMWGLSLGGLPAAIAPDLDRLTRGTWFGGVQLVLGPPLALAMVFVRAATFHGILVLLGGSRLGFEATLRVVAYGRATHVLALLPICGALVGAVWELVVTVIGLARIHGCEEWKALVAVLAPLVAVAMLWGGGLLALAFLAIVP